MSFILIPFSAVSRLNHFGPSPRHSHELNELTPLLFVHYIWDRGVFFLHFLIAFWLSRQPTFAVQFLFAHRLRDARRYKVNRASGKPARFRHYCP